MRLFTALDVHPDIRGNAEDLQERLKERVGGVKWVDPGKMHLTVKFLGDVEADRLDRVRDILRDCGEEHEPFSLRFQSVGQFPRRGTPKVIWVGVEEASGEDVLHSCFSYLDQRMTEVGVDRDDRSFHPHLTLGRVKQKDQLGSFREAFEREEHTVLGEQQVEEIVLYESELTPDGAKYSVKEQASLEA